MRDARARALAAGARAGANVAKKRLSQVATRCQLATTFTSNKNIMSRTYRHMRANAQRFKIVVSAGFVDSAANFTESPLGANPTVTASVEYPLGTHTRVTFGGAAKGIIPDLGHLESDWIEVAIPVGEKFGTDLWMDNAAGNGLAYSSSKLAPDMGDLFARATSTADSTMGGTFTGTSTTESLMPSAIIAESQDGAVIICGDSIAFGVAPMTALAATDGRIGIVETSLGTLPYLNIAVAGDWGWYFRNSHDWRMALANYASVAVYEYGINDITGSRTAAQVADDRQNFLQSLPLGMPAYLTTVIPRTASSDNWATTGNQSFPSAGRETIRVTENTARKASPTGWAGCFDTESVIESAPSSGLWYVTGVANATTSDGTHPTNAAVQRVVDAELIDAAALRARRFRAFTEPTKRGLPVPYRRASSQTLPTDYAGRTITNMGATALATYTLPSPVDGLVFDFIVADADGIRVQVATSSGSATSRIYLGGSVSADGGYIQSTTLGSTVRLECHAGSWYARASTGTWAAT